MSKLTELKAFIDAQSDINCNVVYPMIDSVVDSAVAEVDADVLTYKTVDNTEATPSGVTPVTIGTTVAFSTATSGATIYYTVDGSTPDNTDLVYSAPIAVTEDITFKTIAYKGYQNPSTVQTHTFTIDLAATPVASPVAGEVAGNTEVALTCATADSTIYYTDDGSEPTDESTEYTGVITITDPVTIKAIAYAPTYKPSLVLTAAYTIQA